MPADAPIHADGAMPGPGRGLHHVGYWVASLDAAQRRWRGDLGAGPFEVVPHIAFDSFVLCAGGQLQEGVVFDHSAAFALWGQAIVELGEVHAIDHRLAAAYGYAPGRVSHVAWVVPDLERESARLAGLGCELINTARSGPVRVAWHYGGPLFPHPVEVHQHSSVIDGMQDRLAALRAGEDSGMPGAGAARQAG
jgi:catechol 2,3-dioxygenase-like lactoylglutathione lyase family enzyme